MKQILHNFKLNSGYQIRVLLISVLFSMFTNFASAQFTPIPDANFEQELINLTIDSGPIDGQVLTSNITSVEFLDLTDKSIASLEGINDFVNLKYLYCANNALTSLNVSGLTNLWELVANNNSISSLDVSSSLDLYYLDCERNQLSSLDITGLTRLQTLIVWVNQLTSLDVSNNPDLTYLDCDGNQFTSVNVTGLAKLETFYCSGNKLASINVTGTSSLSTFYCYLNTPSGIDIIVDNVQTAITKSQTIDTSVPDYFWKKDEASVYTYCQTGLNTTWNGSSWSSGAPTSGTAAIISGNYSEAANIDACTLTVNNNAIASIPSGYKVTLNAPITVEAGSSFTLSNNANLIQTNKNSINTGSITVNRNSSLLKRLDYTLWSSPVSGAQTLADFSPLTSQSPSRFYSFDTTYNIGGVNGEYSAIATPTSTTFAAGAGYLIRMPNTADPVTPTAYSGVFTGLPNNGTVPVALIDGLAAGLRYNLVGNPYPSTVNMTQFVTDNSSNIESTLYFWRKTNGVGTAYCTWAPAVSPATGTFVSNGNTQSVDPLGVLQTGQGFFVEAKPGATSLTFNNSQRVADNAGQFFKTKQVVDAGRVWLNATNTAGDFSQMAVTYSAKATQGVDIYDGKYINDSKFALTSNINNGEYTIQSRPVFDTTDVVALNFKTATAGDYTIAIDHVDGLFATDQDIYLVDSKTGTETNLKTSSYNFTATSGVDNTRFSLKYQKTLKVDASKFNDNSVKVYVNNGTLYVNSGALAIANIKIFDIQGRLIKEQTNIKSTTATIGNLRASNQVLIVQVKGEDNSEVTKKVMN